MTTVVVIVLAMTMLALGLTLVRTLFKGAIFTAQSLTENTQKEIDKIFSEEGKDLILVGPTSRSLGICPDTQPYLHYYLATKEGGTITLTITKSEPTSQCRGFENSIITRLSVPANQNYGANDVRKTDTVLLTVPANVPAGCGFYLTLTAKWPNIPEPSSDSMFVQVKSKGVLGCTSD
jgi:hypothetical protein